MESNSIQPTAQPKTPETRTLEVCELLKNLTGILDRSQFEALRENVSKILAISSPDFGAVREQVQTYAKDSVEFHLTESDWEIIRSNPHSKAAASSLARAQEGEVDELELTPDVCPWPGNRITTREIKRLRALCNAIKRPINQLVQDAIESYTSQVIHELAENFASATSDNLDRGGTTL